MNDAKTIIENLKKITEGLKKINGGFPQFRKWILEGNSIEDPVGLTRTGLHDLNVKLINISKEESEVPTELKFLANRFLEAFKLYKEQTSIINFRIQDNHDQFCGCTWFMYFFHNNNHGDVKLARVTLQLDESGKASLLNIRDGKSDDYFGKFTLLNNRIGIFDFRGKEQPAKKLHIQTIMGPSPRELSLGIYLTNEHNTVVSGTVALELVAKENNLDLDPIFLSHKHNWNIYQNIPNSIRRFLSRKHLNYLKVPEDVFDSEELNLRLKNHRTNKRTLFFNVDKPIVFISTPVNSITEEAHSKIKEHISALKSKIEEHLPEVNVVYPGEKRRSIVEKTTFLENLEILKHTQFFVLIHSEPEAVSSATIEMSWALVYCKSVIIFHKEGAIPELVPDLHNSRRLNYLVTREINDLEKDLDKICKKTIVEIAHQLRTEYLDIDLDK